MNAASAAVGVNAGAPDAIRVTSWRRIVREPLLHFALIGAAIFAGAHYIEQMKQQRAQASIVVDTGLRQRLANLYRTQFGVAPTAAQLQVIVDDYIDDEVLYREARKIGLDQDDEIIRRRLIQKLEFLQRDAVAAAQSHDCRTARLLRRTPGAVFGRTARLVRTGVSSIRTRAATARALARAQGSAGTVAGTRRDGRRRCSTDSRANTRH